MTTWNEEDKQLIITDETFNDTNVIFNDTNVQFGGITQVTWTEENK
jgi:hypothetical protein